MTKRIEEVLGLPSLEEVLGETQTDETDAYLDGIANALATSDTDIEKSLIDPDGSREHAKEMDAIADAAMRAHKDLIDLGFNMEPKNAGSIFEPAARMLEIALKASQNKTDAKMKSIKLKMDKEKHDADLLKNQEEGVIDDDGSGKGILADRNAMLSRIREKKSKDS